MRRFAPLLPHTLLMALLTPDPAGGSFKQNRISSVFERLLGRPLGRIANGVRRHYLSY